MLHVPALAIVARVALMAAGDCSSLRSSNGSDGGGAGTSVSEPLLLMSVDMDVVDTWGLM